MFSSAVYNQAKTDFARTPIILGQPRGLVDTIHEQYPEQVALYEQLRGQDWTEKEFVFEICKVMFRTCDPVIANDMIRTLAWQWKTDSLAASTIAGIMSGVCSDSRIWIGYQRISDNECYAEGTEALTPSGWKDLKDISIDDLVAQYVPETKVVEFVNPTRVINKDYSGDMYRFRSYQGHFDQLVTPNHRMGLRKRIDGSFAVKFAEDADYQKGSAGDHIAAENSGYLFGPQQRLSPIERMLIAVQADGSISSRYTGELVGTVPVWFSLVKPRKINRLIDLAADCGFTLVELTPGDNNGSRAASRRFKVNVPVEYAKFLKNFNYFNLEGKDLNWCIDFLDEMVQWDGHFTKNTGILNTTNEQVACFTQAVATVCGRKTHLRRIPDDRKDTYNDIFRLSWKNQSYTSGQTIIKEKVEYEGVVRCLSVPSGFFLIRYNNAVSVGGNSIHALTYSRIVQQSFDDAEKVYHQFDEDMDANTRLEVVGEVFGRAFEYSHRWALFQHDPKRFPLTEKEQYDAYDAMFMYIVGLFGMERCQFMPSFAVTFGICETGIFQPIGDAIQRIAQDELEIHVPFGMRNIQSLLETERGQEAYKNNRSLIVDFINETIAHEDTWVDVLHQDGHENVGYTSGGLKKFGHFSGTHFARFMNVAEDVNFPLVDENPLPYMAKRVNLAACQFSPQEAPNPGYMVNTTKRDDQGKQFDFEL